MKEECLICKAPLEYLQEDIEMECELCHKREMSIPGDSGSSAYFGIYTLGRYISFASNN